jgi:hypothetical protein
VGSQHDPQRTRLPDAAEGQDIAERIDLDLVNVTLQFAEHNLTHFMFVA